MSESCFFFVYQIAATSAFVLNVFYAVVLLIIVQSQAVGFFLEP